jgi:hypothetical protein
LETPYSLALQDDPRPLARLWDIAVATS